MIDTLINKIIQNPLFLRLKEVVENGPYHDHEDVYSHVLKVKDTALREINVDFIKNTDAKSRFLNFIQGDFHGCKRGDIMILIALLHDIGKVLHIKEGKITRPILATNDVGQTFCPGHEYWGSNIVNKFIDLPKEIVEYVAAVIRNHDTFNPGYFEARKNLSWDLLVNDVKSRAEGYYIEALFNIYCDCFTGAPFQQAKEMIIKIFNEPKLYERRKYVIT